MKQVDPYHLWFQISPSEQPANHYRLLGLVDFESDPEVIENAAERRLIFLRSVQNGPNGRLAQELSNEVSRARIVLLTPESKANYDSELQKNPPPSITPPSITPPGRDQIAVNDPRSKHSGKTRDAEQLLPQASSKSALVESPSLIPSLDLGESKSISKPRTAAARSRRKWMIPAVAGGMILIVGTFVYLAISFPTQSDHSTDENSPNDFQNISDKQESATATSRSKTKPNLKLIAKSLEDRKPKSLDLLSLLEFPVNLRQGAGNFSSTKLSLKSQTSINLVDFPIYLPSHFRLEAKVTRRSLNDGFGFGMHVAGFPCLLMLDGFPDQGFKTSIRQIVNPPDDKTPRNDIHTGQLLKQDQTHDILLIVKPTSVQLFVDQKLSYSWSGDPSKIRPAPYILPGDSLYQLWLTSWKTKFDVEDLRLIPDPENTSDDWFSKCIVPKPLTTIGPSINLLEKFKFKSIIRKRVTLANRQIIIGPGSRSGVEIPYKLPLEYDLHLTVVKTGQEGFALLPPFHDRRFALMIDQLHEGKLRSGIQTVHRQYISGGVHPGHVTDEILETRNGIELECRVRRDSIRFFKEGKFILGWTGGRNPIVAPAWKGYSGSTGKHFLRLASLSNQIHVAKLSFNEVIYRDRVSVNDKRLKVIELSPAIKLYRAAR